MNSLTELKFALGGYITDTSLFNKDQKLQLLEFIQSANKYQLMIFALDGKIVPKTNDDVLTEIVEARFISEQAARKTTMSIAGIVLTMGIFGPLIWMVYRGIRSLLDECTGKCGVIHANTTRRQECMVTCKIRALQEAHKKIMSYSCSKSSDKKACENMKKLKSGEIGTKLVELKKKADYYNQRIASKGFTKKEPAMSSKVF